MTLRTVLTAGPQHGWHRMWGIRHVRWWKWSRYVQSQQRWVTCGLYATMLVCREDWQVLRAMWRGEL